MLRYYNGPEFQSNVSMIWTDNVQNIDSDPVDV